MTEAVVVAVLPVAVVVTVKVSVIVVVKEGVVAMHEQAEERRVDGMVARNQIWQMVLKNLGQRQWGFALEVFFSFYPFPPALSSSSSLY